MGSLQSLIYITDVLYLHSREQLVQSGCCGCGIGFYGSGGVYVVALLILMVDASIRCVSRVSNGGVVGRNSSVDGGSQCWPGWLRTKVLVESLLLVEHKSSIADGASVIVSKQWWVICGGKLADVSKITPRCSLAVDA